MQTRCKNLINDFLFWAILRYTAYSQWPSDTRLVEYLLIHSWLLLFSLSLSFQWFAFLFLFHCFTSVSVSQIVRLSFIQFFFFIININELVRYKIGGFFLSNDNKLDQTITFRAFDECVCVCMYVSLLFFVFVWSFFIYSFIYI